MGFQMKVHVDSPSTYMVKINHIVDLYSMLFLFTDDSLYASNIP